MVTQISSFKKIKEREDGGGRIILPTGGGGKMPKLNVKPFSSDGVAWFLI